MQLEEDEIEVGLAAWLDPAILRAGGATVTAAPQVQVQALHLFLCVEDLPDGRSRWIPLFSKPAVGRLKLEGRKTGHSKWAGADSYYRPDQVWTASRGAVIAASVQDASSQERRHRLHQQDVPQVGFKAPMGER